MENKNDERYVELISVKHIIDDSIPKTIIKEKDSIKGKRETHLYNHTLETSLEKYDPFKPVMGMVA